MALSGHGRIFRLLMNDFHEFERRASARITLHFPIRLMAQTRGVTETFEAQTVNLGIHGLYCIVKRYVPVFAKLLLTLIAPGHDGQPAHVLSQVDAVVVRIEPAQPVPGGTEYHAALFFPELSDQQHAALTALLAFHAPHI